MNNYGDQHSSSDAYPHDYVDTDRKSFDCCSPAWDSVSLHTVEALS